MEAQNKTSTKQDSLGVARDSAFTALDVQTVGRETCSRGQGGLAMSDSDMGRKQKRSLATDCSRSYRDVQAFAANQLPPLISANAETLLESRNREVAPDCEAITFNRRWRRNWPVFRPGRKFCRQSGWKPKTASAKTQSTTKIHRRSMPLLLFPAAALLLPMMCWRLRTDRETPYGRR